MLRLSVPVTVVFVYFDAQIQDFSFHFSSFVFLLYLVARAHLPFLESGYQSVLFYF